MNRQEEAHTEVAGVRLPSRLLDGFQVHRAALARDLEVLSLPRQVLLAGQVTTVPAQLSFTHGVPEASGLSAVTFAQDHRLTRALLERAKVPKPAGASFSWRSIGRAERWATKLGFPVVLREGVGENPVRAIRHINSGEELRDAFSTLRRRDKADRTPGSNPYIAGYATTRLTFTYDDEGNEVAPLRSRMLVEKDTSGQPLRAFVVGGTMVAAVELDDNHVNGVRDVTDELGPDVVAVFVAAAGAIPGLACATVDAICSDSRQVDPKQALVVTSVSERPRIETYASAKAELGNRIGDALLTFQARAAGVELGPNVESVTRRLEIEGLRNADYVAKHLPATAKTHGAEVDIGHVDAVTGTVEASASGSPDVLAALIELLMAGALVNDKAAAVNSSRRDS